MRRAPAPGTDASPEQPAATGPAERAHHAAAIASDPCHGILICPVCGDPLRDADRSLTCPRRHDFDRAREGHVDLLPSGHGRSKKAGDAPAMLRARRRFLDGGYYTALSNELNELAVAHVRAADAAGARVGRLAVAEAGCGEGYYVGRFGEKATREPLAGEVCLYGLDLANAAVRMAARRYAGVRFFVNDVTHRLCFADGSIDVLLNVFAPRNEEEFRRVVRPGGLAAVAIPAPNHLAELRSAVDLLEVPEDKEEQTAARLRAGFRLVARRDLEHRVEVPGEAVADLLRMTPNYRHLSEETIATFATSQAMMVTFAFTILGFRRTAGSVARADPG